MEPLDKKSIQNNNPFIENTDSGPINYLPQDAIELIFSSLNEMDLQQASEVSKHWNISATSVAKQEFSSIKAFVNQVIDQLPPKYDKLKDRLIDAINQSSILSSVNLIQVKSSRNGLKEDILNILKDLEEPDLKHLEKTLEEKIESKLLRNAFSLTKIYKDLDKVHGMTDNLEKSSALRDISNLLIKNGNIDKVIEVANKISIEAANNMSISWRKLETLSIISNSLYDSGNIDKAIEVANTIPDHHSKSQVLLRISSLLGKSGNTDKAIEVANTIPDDLNKSYVLVYISNLLGKNGDINKAKEVADTIPDPSEKARALEDIYKM